MHSFKRQIYKFGLIEDNDKNPPTVDDSFEEYTSGIFQFNTSHFTNNFQDIDSDSYKLTRIRTLPSVGVLSYAGNPVEEGFVFNLDNVSNLTYELPDNYMISNNGYCKFEKSISTLIDEQGTEGFELTYLGSGRLEFEKKTTSTLPNETDIYAFFDATSMKIEDAQAAQAALLEWYSNFQDNNPSFTGTLYILPIVKEDWLDFPNIILRGSSNRVRNNSDRPNDDFMALAILPPNFDLQSNNVNPSWTVPTKVVTLAFIDEVADGTEHYHKNRNGYGFSGQPSPQYFIDYKNFVDNFNKFDFFKGVLYPIPDIEYGNYNNIGNAMVLQGFGAIEGGATYKLQEIKDLGVTFAEERRFHWHLDPTHPNYSGTNRTVANPYSAAANTPVPNTNYNLQGLKDFGWAGVYDKDQPASNVFTSDTFNADLNKYLSGSIIETVEKRVIEGECFSAGNICFDFQTSDDSTYTLYSNIATFCLTGTGEPSKVQEANAPTVDSVVRTYDKGVYQFTTLDFTTNFNDIDGDSYQDTTLTTGLMTSKGNPITGLTNSGNPVAYPFNFNLTNVSNLQFQLDEKLTTINDRLVEFGADIDILTLNLENQGYNIIENQGNKLIYNRLNESDPVNPFIETQTIEGKDIGDKTICLSFKTSDDSSYKLYSNTNTMCLEMENEHGFYTVEGGSDNLTSMSYTYKEGDFTNNFTGTNVKTIKVYPLEDSGIGELVFNNYKITTPFSFKKENVGNLKLNLKGNHAIYNGVLYRFDDNIQDVVDNYRNQGYSLYENKEGKLRFVHDAGTKPEVNYEGIVLDNSQLNVNFAVTNDDNIEYFSNEEIFSLIPLGNINVITVDNQPATIGDITIHVDEAVVTVIKLDTIISQSSPPYNDPENDLLDAIRIKKINPNNLGRFYLNENPIYIGMVITRQMLIDELFTHVGENINDRKSDNFTFEVRDAGSGKWSN
jgi:hypothetical protein